MSPPPHWVASAPTFITAAIPKTPPSFISSTSSDHAILSAVAETSTSEHTGHHMPLLLLAALAVSCCAFCCYLSASCGKTPADTGNISRFEVLETSIDSDRVRAARGTYMPSSCPVCLDDFPPVVALQPAQLPSTTTPEPEATRLVQAVAASSRDRYGSTAPGPALAQPIGEGPFATVVALPCGHVFHEGCAVFAMLAGQCRLRCPVCEGALVPVKDNADLDTSAESGPQNHAQLYEPEFHFRLRQLRTFFPDVGRRAFLTRVRIAQKLMRPSWVAADSDAGSAAEFVVAGGGTGDGLRWDGGTTSAFSDESFADSVVDGDGGDTGVYRGYALAFGGDSSAEGSVEDGEDDGDGRVHPARRGFADGDGGNNAITDGSRGRDGCQLACDGNPLAM